MIALGALGIIRAARGKLREAKRLSTRAIQSRPASPVVGLSCLVLAALAYEWDDLEEARRRAAQGIEAARRTGNVEVECGGYRILAQVCQALGEPSGAQEALTRVDQLAARAALSPLQRSRNAAAHVQLALRQGDIDGATRWAESVRESADASMFCPLLNITPARLLLARGHQAEAAGVLVALRPANGSTGGSGCGSCRRCRHPRPQRRSDSSPMRSPAPDQNGTCGLSSTWAIRSPSSCATPQGRDSRSPTLHSSSGRWSCR